MIKSNLLNGYKLLEFIWFEWKHFTYDIVWNIMRTMQALLSESKEIRVKR